MNFSGILFRFLFSSIDGILENEFTDLNGAKSQKKGQRVFVSTWS